MKIFVEVIYNRRVACAEMAQDLTRLRDSATERKNTHSIFLAVFVVTGYKIIRITAEVQ